MKQTNKINRRKFLSGAALAGSLLFSTPYLPAGEPAVNNEQKNGIGAENEAAITQAQALIAQHKADCVLVKDGKIAAQYSGRGVAPILAMHENQRNVMPGAILVDRVIGRAAASAVICGKCAMVQTELISKDAIELLQKYNVKIRYTTVVEKILNRDKSDICPMEKLVSEIEKPEDMLAALKAKLGNAK